MEKKTYGMKDGSWEDVTVDDLYKIIGLIIYMGFVKVILFTLIRIIIDLTIFVLRQVRKISKK